MKITLAQINPKIGDLKNNAELILKLIRKIQFTSDKPDLLVFPELSLIGYPPKDLLLSANFIEESLKTLNEILVPEIKTPTLIGNISLCERDGKLYNSLIFIQDKKVQKIFHKKLLPNYEVFNESRYFASGSIDDCILEIQGKKVGVFICEDLLGIEDDFSFYASNPLTSIKPETKLDLAICAAASPFRLHQPEKRIEFAKKASLKLNCPIALVNQVGANDDLIFDGSSFVLGKDGQLIDKAEIFVEEILTSDTEVAWRLKSKNIPTEAELLRRALVLGIRDYFQKTNFTKAFIGISGGIDSALVAALAVQALGQENVCGILMPSAYSSEGSVKDSEKLLQNFGVQAKIIEIQPILETFLGQANLPKLTLAEENLQSRIRGAILMAMSNQENALVLATGNKSEFAVGYSTLYGDMCGALAPIGDLYKTQVWEIAKTFPEIPLEIIEKTPSAELRPDQKDSDSLPEYNLLDEILKLHLEQKLSAAEIKAKNLDPEIVEKVLKLVSRSEFKRKQAPIILKVSKHTFGSGWQYPVACLR